MSFRLKRNILISKCPFNFDEILVQSKIISEYVMHLCSEQCTTIREKWPGPARRSARGTRWPRSRRSAWGTRRLTPARGKGRRGRSTAVIGVMTRKIIFVITSRCSQLLRIQYYTILRIAAPRISIQNCSRNICKWLEFNTVPTMEVVCQDPL